MTTVYTLWVTVVAAAWPRASTPSFPASGARSTAERGAARLSLRLDKRHRLG